MPRALAIFATLCLLAAVAYAFWPDGADSSGEAESASLESSGASAGAGGSRRAGAAGSGNAGRSAPAGDGEGEAASESAPAVEDGAIRVEVKAKGAPLPGARVRLYRRGNRDPNTNQVPWTAMGAAQAGADGSATFPAGPGRYVVVADADKLGRSSRPVLRAAGDPLTRVVLALSEPKVLNGRVQAKLTREPIPLADVTLVPAVDAEFSGVDEMPPEERLTLRADARGAFQFKGLSAGSYDVSATAPGYGTDEQEVRLPMAEDVVLELVPAGVLEGYVQASDGAPAVGAQVDVAGADQPISVSTGTGGGFSVEVPPGTYRLSARRGGEAGALPSPVTVAARTTARGLVIRMGKAASIAGDVVRRGSGKPVAGARVDVSPYLAAGDSGRAITDDAGRFTVSGLAPGSYDVVVNGEDLSEQLERGITVRNGEQYTLHLEVSGTASIEGVVTNEQGKPIRGAVVTETPPLGDGPGASAVTDEEGRYRLTGVQVGRTPVNASRVEGGYTARTVVEVAEGETGHADFTLPDTSVLEGRVVSKAGGALRMTVSVRLYQVPKRRWLEAEVDEDGAFRVELPPDEYRLLVFEEPSRQKPPLASQSVRVEAGKISRVEIPVDDSESSDGVTVLVLEPGGIPSPDATVWVARGGRPFRGARTDESGRATLPPIQGEGMTLRAFNGGRVGEVPYAGAGHVTINLRPAATLRGRVSGGGVPVAGFLLDTELSEWRFGGPGTLSFPGDEFLVTDLPPERVTVNVATTDGRKGSASVTLTPGATAEVTVMLDAASQVRARVVDRSGRPLRGAVVLSVEDDRTLGRAGGDGKVSVVWPGTASVSKLLRFEADGYAPVDRRVELKAGQAVDLGDVALAVAGG